MQGGSGGGVDNTAGSHRKEGQMSAWLQDEVFKFNLAAIMLKRCARHWCLEMDESTLRLSRSIRLFANAFPADNAVSTVWRRGRECARVVGFPWRYWSRYRAKRMQGTKAQSSSRSPLNPGDQCRAYARARRRIAMSREGLWRRCRSSAQWEVTCIPRPLNIS
jgi:hypothetical protein